MRQIDIRPYRADDRDSCVRLCAELAAHHSALYVSPVLADRDPGAGFDDYLGTARVWVAEDVGQVVGFAGTVAAASKAELEPVVVASTVRRRGVGRRLVEAAVAEAVARGANQVFVRPAARNLEAIRFFHACGLDVLTRVELAAELRAGEARPAGERVAGRPFRT